MSQNSKFKTQALILGIRSETADAMVVLSTLEETLLRAVDRIEWTAGRQLSSSLLDKIEELLDRNHKTWKDLSGIVTYEGPGSFTGLRIGITVANTAAYILNIPIVGATGDEWMKQGVSKLNSDHFDDIVMPHYGSEPNITSPKK